MEIALSACTVRSWRPSDADSIARHANNRKIWLNLRDAFPYPYERHHAREFIRTALQRSPQTNFAIVVDGEAVGSIGFVPHGDVERMSAEIGYWIAESCWGRGVMSEALKAVTLHAIDNFGLTRIFAVPFAGNAASCRVLEKAGYVLEGRLRRSAIKNGEIIDQLQYAFIADPPPDGIRG